MIGIYESNLARSIAHKLSKALTDAGQGLVPPGTLGAGVSVTQISDTNHVYDPVRGVLTITGEVKIDVHGIPDSR